MCATPDKKSTDEFRSRKGRQYAYKVIKKPTGEPHLYADWGFKYQPGRNVDPRATGKSYRTYHQRYGGFHCYLSRAPAVEDQRSCNWISLAVVRVSFDPADVIVVEKLDRFDDCQVVVRALNISARAWKQAGLPAMTANTGEAT